MPDRVPGECVLARAAAAAALSEPATLKISKKKQLAC